MGETIVILIHGIRTSGWWQSKVATCFAREPNVEVIPLKFQYVDLLSFLLPIEAIRARPIEELRRELQEVVENNPSRKIVIFAHSFGTFAITRILRDNRKIMVDRLLLCGSIVPENFDWLRVSEQIKTEDKRAAIINDCGTLDIWPVLAKSITWGYGATGTFGAGRANLTDRFHEFGHGGFFSERHLEQYWLPFVRGDRTSPTQTDASGSKNPWYFLAFRFPWRYVILSAPLVFLGIFVAGEKSCPSGETTLNGQCVSAAPESLQQEAEVAKLKVQIGEIIVEVNQTLNQKNASLFPALDEFSRNPTEQNWRSVQKQAESLLEQVNSGIRMVEEYDAKLISSGENIFLVSNGIKQLVETRYSNGFKDTGEHWQGRSNLTGVIISRKEIPTVQQAREWEQSLRQLHEGLSEELQQILSLLDAA